MVGHAVCVTSDPIQLQKATWTDTDFDTMGWHDVALHAIAIEPVQDYPGRVLLDIDYIVKWEPPPTPAASFGFWMSPATLVFDEASDLAGEIDLVGWAF